MILGEQGAARPCLALMTHEESSNHHPRASVTASYYLVKKRTVMGSAAHVP